MGGTTATGPVGCPVTAGHGAGPADPATDERVPTDVVALVGGP